MRVDTNQALGFSDASVAIPHSELDTLQGLIDWSLVDQRLGAIKGDYAPLSLFKAMLLQTWHNLSDAGIADALRRDLVFMHFCGFSLEGKKPDAATVCRFRNRLVRVGLFDDLLAIINESLAGQGMKLANGKYISSDATLIQSARRPRKVINADETCSHVEVEYSDDKEATWLRKGDQCVYGYSSNVTTDEDGLIESVTTFSANRSEMTRLDDVLANIDNKPDQVMLYDKGVDSGHNRELLKQHGLKDGIMRKKPKGTPMTHWHRLRNKLIGKKRFVVERTFGTLKRTYGMNRARYVGLIKTQAEVLMKSIAYNLKRGLNRHLKQAPLQVRCV